MKFAFSSSASPSSDPATLAARAQQLGYDGVELKPVIDAEQAKDAFAETGVAIAALATSAAYSGDKGKDEQVAAEIRKAIESARAMNCPLVKMLDAAPRRMPPGQIAPAMAAWLAPLAEYAAQRGVRLAVANALFFRTARDMWLLMEQVNDPAMGVCWDALSAALSGETPAISVPTLGNRIQCVQVRDAVLKSGVARLCRPGEGDVRLADLFRRLQGIGYRGWVTVGGEIAAGEADPADALAQSLALLKKWTEAKAPAPAAKKPAAAAVAP